MNIKQVRLSASKLEIINILDESKKRVFRRIDLGEIFKTRNLEWKLDSSTSLNNFISFLINHCNMSKVILKFPSRKETRYLWREVSDYQLVLSLRSNAYFSHQSAMYLQKLTESTPNIIYLNQEQPAKAISEGKLSQGAIDRAFRNNVRVSKNRALFNNKTICVLSGKSTGQLGVTKNPTKHGDIIPVTNVERTLIDAAVRPVYSGGVKEVLGAYKLARDKADVEIIENTLRVLGYTYPYHQIIGFYLERSGYAEGAQNLFLDIGLEFDFYLEHNMGEMSYSKKWRLFYPKEF